MTAPPGRVDNKRMIDPTWPQIVMMLLQTFMAILLSAALPWGYRIGTKIAAIEVNIKHFSAQDAAMTELFKRVNRLESRLAALSGKTNGSDTDK